MITVEKGGADEIEDQPDGSHDEHELRVFDACCTLIGWGWHADGPPTLDRDESLDGL